MFTRQKQQNDVVVAEATYSADTPDSFDGGQSTLSEKAEEETTESPSGDQVTEDALKTPASDQPRTEKLVSTGEVASRLGMTESDLMTLLEKQKVIRRKDSRFELSEQVASAGFAVLANYSFPAKNGWLASEVSVVWTENGIGFIEALLEVVEKKQMEGNHE